MKTMVTKSGYFMMRISFSTCSSVSLGGIHHKDRFTNVPIQGVFYITSSRKNACYLYPFTSTSGKGIVYMYCNGAEITSIKRNVFVWDFPLFVKAREIYFFIYLFIYLSTREKCLSRGFYLSREDWIPVHVFSLCIVRRPFLFSDFGFWRT